MSCTRFRVNLHCSCLNVKELLAWSRHIIWSLSDCNWTQTQNHLVRKRTLNYLAKPTKWLSCDLSTYLYGTIDCMFLSCHVRISEWIHTLKRVRDMIRTYSRFHRTGLLRGFLNFLNSSFEMLKDPLLLLFLNVL